MRQPQDPSAERTLGGYTLLNELGRGSNGVVLLARREDLEGQVALKILTQKHPLLVARFEQEARLASRVDDPGVVPCLDTGQDGPYRYLAMEFVPGLTLAQQLARGGAMLPADALRLVQQLARTLARAHALGVVHRDLKPSNVLLDPRDPEAGPAGRPRITDFGLSKDVLRQDALTMTADVIGTPNYMAPEQLAGSRQVDARCDVYAAGVILYECLTGQRAFKAPNLPELAEQIRRGQATPPSRRSPHPVPPELDALCLRAMEPDQDRRIASAQELANELGRVLAELEQPPRASLAPLALGALAAALLAAVSLLLAGGNPAPAGPAVLAQAPSPGALPNRPPESPSPAGAPALPASPAPPPPPASLKERESAYAEACASAQGGAWARALSQLDTALGPGSLDERLPARDEAAARLLRGLTSWQLDDPANAQADWGPLCGELKLEEVLLALAALPERLRIPTFRGLVGSLRVDLASMPGPRARAALEARGRAASAAAREPLTDALLAAASGAPWDELATSFERAHEAAPDDPVVLLERVRLLVGRDRYREAGTALTAARGLPALNGQLAELERLAADLVWRGGNLHDCIPQWERVDLAHGGTVEGLCSRAEANLLSLSGSDADGGLARTQAALEAGLELDPSHARLRFAKAALLLRQREPLQALVLLDQVLADEGALDSQVVTYRAYAMDTLLQRGGFPFRERVAEYEHVFGLSEGAFHRIGPAGVVLGRERSPSPEQLEWASRLLGHAASREPERAHAHQYLGTVNALRGGPLAETLAAWRRAKELEPRNPFDGWHVQAFLRTYGRRPELSEFLSR